MPYGLGIDLGSRVTRVAVDHGVGPVTVPLAEGTTELDSILSVGPDGALSAGVALYGAQDEVYFDFVRRVGTPARGLHYRPEEATALFVRWVIDTVTAQYGEAPATVVLTHPASWTRAQRALADEALAATGLLAAESAGRDTADLAASGPLVDWLPASEAAALGAERFGGPAFGDTVALYSLGATCSTAVLTRVPGGRLVQQGPAVEVPGIGGDGFDDAVLAHVLDGLDRDLRDVDPDDPATIDALDRLLYSCRLAREQLTSTGRVVIPVDLPSGSTRVSMIRADYDALARTGIGATVDTLRAVADGATRAPESILVVGGLAPTPLVARELSAEFDLPVLVPPRASEVAALGAARAAAAALPGARSDTVAAVTIPTGRTESTTVEAAPRTSRTRTLLIATAAAVTAVAVLPMASAHVGEPSGYEIDDRVHSDGGDHQLADPDGNAAPGSNPRDARDSDPDTPGLQPYPSDPAAPPPPSSRTTPSVQVPGPPPGRPTTSRPTTRPTPPSDTPSTPPSSPSTPPSTPPGSSTPGEPSPSDPGTTSRTTPDTTTPEPTGTGPTSSNTPTSTSGATTTTTSEQPNRTS